MKEELLPFKDEQDKRPMAFCRQCGREIYGMEGQCLYCLKYNP